MSSMGVERPTRPVIIVTGANGGVGFATCQRLLLQLCQRVPQDSLPQPSIVERVRIDEDADVDFHSTTDVARSAASEGLTLILACRSVQRAEEAKVALLRTLDAEIARIEVDKGDGWEKDVAKAAQLRGNVDIVIEKLDLSSLKSVFGFATEISRKYSYVSHIVCNAGLANFIGYDWPLAIRQVLTEIVVAVTRPLYKLQRKGELSVDGLGLVMQCNVLSHYFLFRLLEPLLKAYKDRTSAPSRVLWTSSLEADPSSYDPNDWQLLNSEKPYDASKYQIDLLAGHLELEQQRELSAGADVPVRHLLIHPGVVRTNIATKSLNSCVLDSLMQLAFFIAHCLGSTAHVWTTYKASISAVHLILVALPFVTVASKDAPSKPHILDKLKEKRDGNGNERYDNSVPLKFGSEVDFWFREYVGVTKVLEWEDRKGEAAELVKRFDETFRDYSSKKEYR